MDHAFTHDKIKEIKHELFHQTKVVKDTIQSEFKTYTMVGHEDNKLIFKFRPDLEKPEEVIEVFTIQIHPMKRTWMLTTIGGDYSYEIILELVKLLRKLNRNQIKSLKKWYG